MLLHSEGYRDDSLDCQPIRRMTCCHVSMKTPFIGFIGIDTYIGSRNLY